MDFGGRDQALEVPFRYFFEVMVGILLLVAVNGSDDQRVFALAVVLFNVFGHRFLVNFENTLLFVNVRIYLEEFFCGHVRIPELQLEEVPFALYNLF